MTNIIFQRCVIVLFQKISHCVGNLLILFIKTGQKYLCSISSFKSWHMEWRLDFCDWSFGATGTTWTHRTLHDSSSDSQTFFCLLKQYMGSKEMNQEKNVVLTGKSFWKSVFYCWIEQTLDQAYVEIFRYINVTWLIPLREIGTHCYDSLDTVGNNFISFALHSYILWMLRNQKLITL